MLTYLELAILVPVVVASTAAPRGTKWAYGYAYEVSLGAHVSWPALDVDWSSEYTLAAWFRTHSVAHSGAGLVGAARWWTANRANISLPLQANGGLVLRRDGRLTFLAGSDFAWSAAHMWAPVAPFRWYHSQGSLAPATYERRGNGTATLYIDGRVSGTWAGVGAAVSARTPLAVGRLDTDTSDDTWTGLVDDVAVWNRSLSAGEVAELYRSPGVGVRSQGLVLLGRADSDTRIQAVDSGANGLAGALVQGPQLYGSYSPSVSYRADCMISQGDATCTPLARMSVCGDGAVTGTEQCDGGPGCTTECSCSAGNSSGEYGCIPEGRWCPTPFSETDVWRYWFPGKQGCENYPEALKLFTAKGCSTNDMGSTARRATLSSCSLYCGLLRNDTDVYCFSLQGTPNSLCIMASDVR
eukprot:m51a1_g14171 hypothetical protein (412) ;mRNA; r:21115-22448